MNNRAPLMVAIVLLLLPVLYVGSYLVLVRPAGISDSVFQDGIYWTDLTSIRYYAVVGNSGQRLFWPLEQIDRKLRPNAWGDRFLADKSRLPR
jgi:hypothetical protein